MVHFQKVHAFQIQHETKKVMDWSSRQHTEQSCLLWKRVHHIHTRSAEDTHRLIIKFLFLFIFNEQTNIAKRLWFLILGEQIAELIDIFYEKVFCLYIYFFFILKITKKKFFSTKDNQCVQNTQRSHFLWAISLLQNRTLFDLNAHTATDGYWTVEKVSESAW